jgi:hypothetical protein
VAFTSLDAFSMVAGLLETLGRVWVLSISLAAGTLFLHVLETARILRELLIAGVAAEQVLEQEPWPPRPRRRPAGVRALFRSRRAEGRGRGPRA